MTVIEDKWPVTYAHIMYVSIYLCYSLQLFKIISQVNCSKLQLFSKDWDKKNFGNTRQIDFAYNSEKR